jgi:dephospho-CoA kinase
MFKAGITGGIGSGKSTVARIFEVLGIPVYYADAAAKRLMQHDKELREGVISAFGEHIYPNGTLDRKALASVVFSDRAKLQLLNSLVHPATIRDGEDWAAGQTSPYVLREAALLFESGVDRLLDCMIGVSAPIDLRIKRVMHRDKITREQIQHRIDNQMDEALKMERCDYLIFNDELQLLIPQVVKLHEMLLAKARGPEY